MCEFGLKICLGGDLDNKEMLILHFHFKRELTPSE